jgi:hypothetical protein
MEAHLVDHFRLIADSLSASTPDYAPCFYHYGQRLIAYATRIHDFACTFYTASLLLLGATP